MSEFYGPAARQLQEQFDTTRLADRLEAAIVSDRLSDADQRFVSEADFFFLSTVSDDGFPTVSYKGGPPGLVAVLDERTLAFPSYDGNGMYLSMGNIVESAKIGLLFIDFERPARLRVQARGRLRDDADLVDRFPGAQLVVVAEVTQAWVNCPRYIHRHERVAASRYVPDGDGEAPLAPWKRVEGLTETLPEADRARVAAAGGSISPQRYAELLEAERRGDSDAGTSS